MRHINGQRVEGMGFAGSFLKVRGLDKGSVSEESSNTKVKFGLLS